MANAQVLIEGIGQDVSPTLLVLHTEDGHLSHLVLILSQALQKGTAPGAWYKDYSCGSSSSSLQEALFLLVAFAKVLLIIKRGGR